MQSFGEDAENQRGGEMGTLAEVEEDSNYNNSYTNTYEPNSTRSPSRLSGRPLTPRLRNESDFSSGGYEEFFGGAIECPTCRGLGRIPREQESELVALIPFSDKRLKPRRTKLYVAIAIILCILIAGLLLFFLLPRSVKLESSMPTITPKYTYINVTKRVVKLTIGNTYNISNSNFFDVTVDELDVTIFFDQKILQTAKNTTSIKVPMRATRSLYIEMNVTFSDDDGYIASYCNGKAKGGHTILLPFQASACTAYFGHTEETTLTTYQRVKCSGQNQTHLQYSVSKLGEVNNINTVKVI